MNRFFFYCLALFSITACQQQADSSTLKSNNVSLQPEEQDKRETEPKTLIDSIENAHQKNRFYNYEAIQFDLDLSFNGTPRLKGTVSVSTDSKYVKIEKSNGDVLLFDGKDVYLSPVSASSKGARFDMFTWSYFFTLPYKLQDPGTRIKPFSRDGIPGMRLTFQKNIGDTPDDWYDIYPDSETLLIDAVGYIVTYGGTDIETAAKNAHAISYSSYKTVEGIPFATRWEFYNYSDRKGVDRSHIIGQATLENLRFSSLNEIDFTVPKDVKEIAL